VSVHITYEEGGATFTGYMGEVGKPSAIVHRCAAPYLVLDIPDDGARREGVRLEMDAALADAVAKTMRRALTGYRKRGEQP
jgi:hypothetical protein